MKRAGAQASIHVGTCKRLVRTCCQGAWVLSLLALATCAWSMTSSNAAYSNTAPATTGAGLHSKSANSAATQTGAWSGHALRPAPAPRWNQLSSTQQAFLQPLAPYWGDLSEAQRRKWAEVALQLGRRPANEQARIHERISAWLALKPEQRAQARVNFVATTLAQNPQRMAQWQAYQALSDGQREQLRVLALETPAGAARSIKPVPVTRLAQSPAVTHTTSKPALMATPHQAVTHTASRSTTRLPKIAAVTNPIALQNRALEHSDDTASDATALHKLSN